MSIPSSEIELRKALKAEIEALSPPWWDKTLAEMLTGSKHRLQLAQKLVAVSKRAYAWMPKVSAQGRYSFNEEENDEAALNDYLTRRLARGKHIRGKNPPDSELAALAAPWHSKPDRAADFIRERCRYRNVPEGLWPKQNAKVPRKSLRN